MTMLVTIPWWEWIVSLWAGVFAVLLGYAALGKCPTARYPSDAGLFKRRLASFWVPGDRKTAS